MSIKYIGQDCRIHELGADELSHYNHNHDKLGRFARSVGTGISNARNNAAANSVASRYERINKRQAKIDKFDRKINSNRNQKRLIKSQKYQSKLVKAEQKAKKTNVKLAKGKTLSDKDMRRLAKVAKLQAKVAGKNYKTEKWTAKAQQNEYRNYKDAREINRIVNKYGNVSMSKVKSSDKTNAVKYYLENSAQPIQRNTPYENTYSSVVGETDRKNRR